MTDPISRSDLELPTKPAAPEAGDCCGGGCARCVFDVYEEQLERWERQVAEILEQREKALGRPPQ